MLSKPLKRVRHGVTRSVRLTESDRLQSPVAFGIWRWEISLPPRVTTELGVDSFEFGGSVIRRILKLSERTGFTNNGIVQSIIICIGGAFLAYFVRLMFGIGFGSPGMNAIASSVGALIIVPTHWRGTVRNRRKR